MKIKVVVDVPKGDSCKGCGHYGAPAECYLFFKELEKIDGNKARYKKCFACLKSKRVLRRSV